GSRLLVPVTAQGLQSYMTSATTAARLKLAGPNPPNPHAGLWVGNAIINKVNQPSSLTAPITPLPTASEFHLRLLVHVDDIGTARLLQKVLLMWKNGTSTNNPAGVQVLDQPGHYVLVSDDRFIPQFTGSALRDNEPVARRFSSTAFAIRNPLPFAGTGD